MAGARPGHAGSIPAAGQGISRPLAGKSSPHRWIPMESGKEKPLTSRPLGGRSSSPDSMGDCFSPYINDVDGGPDQTRFFFGRCDADGRGRLGGRFGRLSTGWEQGREWRVAGVGYVLQVQPFSMEPVTVEGRIPRVRSAASLPERPVRRIAVFPSASPGFHARNRRSLPLHLRHLPQRPTSAYVGCPFAGSRMIKADDVGCAESGAAGHASLSPIRTNGTHAPGGTLL